MVGGRNVTIRQYSYHVSIQHGMTRQHVGSGVLVGRNTVLTTAFCIGQAGPNATLIQVRFNSVNHAAGGSLRQVRRVILHPNYNATTLQHNLAIIKLANPARRVTRCTLPPNRFALRNGDNITVSGWGRQFGQQQLGTNLQAVDLQVIDQNVCVRAYQSRLTQVTDDMWCGGWPAGGRGACEVCHFIFSSN